MPIVTEEEHERRLSYYRQGFCDDEIGKYVGKTGDAIGYWRRKQGLPFNPSSNVRVGQVLSPEKDDERMTLYNQGLCDTEIGKRVGKTRSGIGEWRRGRGLPFNPIPKVDRLLLSPEKDKERMILYEQGLLDAAIGREVGVTGVSIGSWRRYRELPSHRPRRIHVPLTDDEKEKICTLHRDNTTIAGIAKELGHTVINVTKFCKEEGLDTSVLRGQRIRAERKWDVIFTYFLEKGPVERSELVALGAVSDTTISKYMYELADEVERLHFLGGKKAYEFYGDLHEKVVYSLKDDPRIIDFLVERLSFVPSTDEEVRWAIQCLSRQVGVDRARQVVRRLGYKQEEDTTEVKGR